MEAGLVSKIWPAPAALNRPFRQCSSHIKPSKRKSTERIDGIVAIVMALTEAMRETDTRSPYESNGITFLSY